MNHVPNPHGHGIVLHEVNVKRPDEGWESEEGIMVDGKMLGLWIRKDRSGSWSAALHEYYTSSKVC